MSVVKQRKGQPERLNYDEAMAQATNEQKRAAAALGVRIIGGLRWNKLFLELADGRLIRESGKVARREGNRRFSATRQRETGVGQIFSLAALPFAIMPS